MQFFINIWNAQRNAVIVETCIDEATYWRRKSDGLTAENAALRSQINQRGAGGKFTKKSPTE